MQEYDPDYADSLEDDIHNSFPNAPFVIACIDNMAELEDNFSGEKVVIIYDGRAHRSNYHYDDIPDDELSSYNNYTRVSSTNGKYITLRDVLNALYNDSHYRREKVADDPHQFLEGFEKSKQSNIQYEIIWGS